MASDVRDRHTDVVAGRHASGPSGRLVFVCSGTDLGEGGDDLLMAAGIAVALVGRGWGVQFIDASGLRGDSPDCDAVVCLDPAADISTVSSDIVCAAWPLAVTRWLNQTGIALYDAVLAPSQLAAAALSECYDGAITVLPPAVDVDLFAETPRRARRATAIVGRAQDTHTDVLTLPSRLRAASGVVVEVETNELRFGAIDPLVLQAVACRVPVVSTSALGLRDLGLEAVEVVQTADAGAFERALARAEQSGDALRDTVLARHSTEVRADQLLVAMARASGRARPPATRGFFPDLTEANPYQQMLYSELAARGVRIAPVTRPLSRAALRDSGRSLDHLVLHVHWTAAILQSAPGPLEALRRLDAFRNQVERLQARGATVVWTVHNVLPHECRHLTVELELHRFLAAAADVVHVMDPMTPDAARDWYDIPASSTRVVPHSSYAGVYPDVVGRTEARRRFGLADGNIALLLLGRIRPYKGLDLLLDAFEELAVTDDRLRLLVAGKAERIPDLESLRRRIDANPRVTAELDHVPDSDLQLWCRAADLAVLPYTDVLNSGSFQLAVTFDLPVVAPAIGSLNALADPAYVRTFDAGSVGSLAEALRSAVRELVPSGAGRAAGDAARSHPPALMAQTFADMLTAEVPRWGAQAGQEGPRD
jgi:glycosyltransferase involved in cell wall biosynthesis